MNVRKYRRKLAAYAALSTLSVGLVACGSGHGSTASKAVNTKPANSKLSSIKVGGVIWGRYLDYWELVQLGMQAAAAHYHVPIQMGTSDKSLGTEAQLLQQMTVSGVNVLAISPFDATGSIAALKQAASSGATVVQYNTQVKDTSFPYFVGVTNSTLGQAIGKTVRDYINNHLGGKAEVGVLSDVSEPGGADRLNGFLSELKGMPGVKVVSNETAAKPDQGASALPTMLQGHPGINIVFGWNGGALQGAVTAAQNLHNTNLKIFGIDMGSVVAQAMRQPNTPVVAVADQHPWQLGYDAVQLGIEARTGKATSKVINLRPTIYSSTNQAQISQWITQDQQAQKEGK